MTKITWNEKADAKVRLDPPLCDRLFGVPIFLSFVPILNNLGGCAECLAYNGKVTGKWRAGLWWPLMALISHLFPRLAQTVFARDLFQLLTIYSLSCWLAYLPSAPTPLISMLSQPTWVMVSTNPPCPWIMEYNTNPLCCELFACSTHMRIHYGGPLTHPVFSLLVVYAEPCAYLALCMLIPHQFPPIDCLSCTICPENPVSIPPTLIPAYLRLLYALC